VYAHPRKMHLQKFHDAFDIAVQVLTWKSNHQNFLQNLTHIPFVYWKASNHLQELGTVSRMN
jgi:hypothetical protein